MIAFSADTGAQARIVIQHALRSNVRTLCGDVLDVLEHLTPVPTGAHDDDVVHPGCVQIGGSRVRLRRRRRTGVRTRGVDVIHESTQRELPPIGPQTIREVHVEPFLERGEELHEAQQIEPGPGPSGASNAIARSLSRRTCSRSTSATARSMLSRLTDAHPRAEAGPCPMGRGAARPGCRSDGGPCTPRAAIDRTPGSPSGRRLPEGDGGVHDFLALPVPHACHGAPP